MTDSTGTTTYQYDYENRLIKTTKPDGDVVEYKYDPFGRRIEKNVNGTITRYVYDREDILFELDASGNVITEFVHGPGIDEPIAMIKNNQTYYYHADGLGSIIAITDSAGNVVQRYEYNSFGEITYQQNPNFKQPYTYTGREYDAESGLYYYRARYYDAKIGRFISEDPIGFDGGDVNFYAYVGNNPVNFVDPWGLHTIGFSGSGVLIIDDYGNPIGYCSATSGLPGFMSPEYQNVPWKGPIPEGRYYFNPNDFSRGGFFRNLLGDWGRWRVPLTPDPGTNTYGRGGFFMHGGNEPGSAGCIDVGSCDEKIYNLLKDHQGPVTVIVNYPSY